MTNPKAIAKCAAGLLVALVSGASLAQPGGADWTKVPAAANEKSKLAAYGDSVPSLRERLRTEVPQANWTKVLAAASKESKVVVYGNTVPPLIERLKADFLQAYPGIALEFSRIVGNPLLAKLDQERQAGIDAADVAIYTESPWHEERAKQGVFKAPAGPAAKSWPAEHLLHGMVPVVAVQPFVIAYNTQLAKSPVTGYQDLLRPEFKGRIGTSDPVGAAVAAWYDWLEQTQGAGFLARFAAQNPRFYNGATPLTQAAASGEVAIASFTIMAVARPLVEQGAPLKVVVPEPSLGTRDVAAILGWSKRPNAAQVFVDYLISARGQTMWSGRGETASPLRGIPGSLDVRTIKAFDSSRYTNEVMKAFVERWNKQFKAQ